MASDRQIAANRVNAKRSTGPRSVGGRLASSRNAVKHGLSRPIAEDSPELGALTALLLDHGVDCANEIALCRSELMRVRGVRLKMLYAVLDGQSSDPDRMRGLNRYERRARARWRGVVKNLVRE